MSLTYIHVSDIHFGQERGSEVYVHDDVKRCLIDDLEAVKGAKSLGRIDGVIVTGDIAFSGKVNEYERAGKWLDELTMAIGCEKTQVMVVPGNHDINRDQISPCANLMLEQITKGGDYDLDRFLANEGDRELLFARLANYRDFAEAYGCRFESDGGVAINRKVEIAPERYLRFIGLNSALASCKDSEEGVLLLGRRQLVLPRTTGEELVVLCHHPLNCLKDGENATHYIRSRARVHMYGHVHMPSSRFEEAVEGGDLLTLSGGAVIPPNDEDGYRYTYNLISFDWDTQTDGLKVTIEPRSWSNEATCFDADTDQFGKRQAEFVLRCPNFRNRYPSEATQELDEIHQEKEERAPSESARTDVQEGENMAKGSDLLRLYFFRDLTAEQRVRVLIKIGVLPDPWTIKLTHGIERRLFDHALRRGLFDKLEKTIDAVHGEEKGGIAQSKKE